MAEQTTTEKKDEKKQELSYDLKLAVDGWPTYYLAAKIEDLNNPDPKQVTLGFKDALGKKQQIINAPVEEWIRILSAVAKKAGNKA